MNYLKEYTKISIDLDNLADQLSQFEDLPGQNSNQDPCFQPWRGFENCIYDDDGKQVWGYTVILSCKDEYLKIKIHIFGTEFSVLHEHCFAIEARNDNIMICDINNMIMDFLKKFPEELDK